MMATSGGNSGNKQCAVARISSGSKASEAIMKRQKAKLIAMAALAACVYAAGAASFDTNSLAHTICFRYDGGCDMRDPFEAEIRPGMSPREISMIPVMVAARECNISTNEAIDAIYAMIDNYWDTAEAVSRCEISRDELQARMGEDSIQVFASHVVLNFLKDFPDDGRKRAAAAKAMNSCMDAIRDEALCIFAGGQMSTNDLYAIHDAFTNAPADVDWLFTFKNMKYGAASKAFAAASTNAVFKDRLNRLDWFLADKFPDYAEIFDQRIAISLPAYGMSIQRLALYNKMRESDFACGKTNLWYKYSQPVMDQLTSVPTNELNDVSAALAW